MPTGRSMTSELSTDPCAHGKTGSRPSTFRILPRHKQRLVCLQYTRLIWLYRQGAPWCLLLKYSPTSKLVLNCSSSPLSKSTIMSSHTLSVAANAPTLISRRYQSRLFVLVFGADQNTCSCTSVSIPSLIAWRQQPPLAHHHRHNPLGKDPSGYALDMGLDVHATSSHIVDDPAVEMLCTGSALAPQFRLMALYRVSIHRQ
jgi:hypothetical protein